MNKITLTIEITLTNEQKDLLIKVVKDEIPFTTGNELVALCEIIAAVPSLTFFAPAPVRLSPLQWHKIHCIIDDNYDNSDPKLFELDKLITEASEAFADAEDAT